VRLDTSIVKASEMQPLPEPHHFSMPLRDIVHSLLKYNHAMSITIVSVSRSLKNTILLFRNGIPEAGTH
jgi:hypothetical protein